MGVTKHATMLLLALSLAGCGAAPGVGTSAAPAVEAQAPRATLAPATPTQAPTRKPPETPTPSPERASPSPQPPSPSATVEETPVSSTDKDTPEPSAAPPAPSPARQAAPTSPPAPSPVVVTPAFTAAPIPPAGSGPSPGPAESGFEALVQVASADLAARLGINVAEVGLLEARSVVWPDGSLGCPEPGMAYQQVQVEGYLIRLAAGGQEYRYHGAGQGGPFLCEQPDAPLPPAPGPGDM